MNNLEAGSLGGVEQFAITKDVPPAGPRFLDDVVLQNRGNAS
jgi:hypothetical protein